MNWYKYSVNIKAGLFILGILLALFFVIFTQSIVKDLRDDNREIVKLYAEIIAGVAADDTDESLNFIFENIIQKVRFPIIQSDSDMTAVSWKNLPNNITTNEQVTNIQKTMDKQNPPIPLVFVDPSNNESVIFGFLHFGDSILINRLRLLPFIQIGAVSLFILIGFIGFNTIRNSEKRHIWAGMARETAHQLGTPVSALMGWLDILKNKPDNNEAILVDIETDLVRLQEISNRFSDMGSKTKFEMTNLIEVIQKVIDYLQRRVPDSSLHFHYDQSSTYLYNCNSKLLSWAIENIIKNGIDATKSKTSIIRIEISEKNDSFIIDISDNGNGIPRRDWRNIFRPGFSTKKYGWGLGLSLTRRIIMDFHNGKIFVKESVVGRGTTISIILR
jgi:hypothetical protein